ncbi:MAG TPA: septum formation initiator family protein [Coriobacteriia bacterium]|nr:septum formation initiator family protein [Coriobacteriia bacterium]
MRASRASRGAPVRRGPAASRACARGARRRWLLPLLLLLIFAAAAWGFYAPVKIHYQEAREQARARAELEALRERNAHLDSQIERLQTPEGVEEVARETLGMVKEGENAFVVVDASHEDSPAVAAAQAEEGAEGAGVWSGLVDLVFGRR